MSIIETDRTSILTYQHCPRKRYWSRHAYGKGIERIRKSLPLVFGSAFHEAAEDLLLGKGVESAVERALRYLDEKFAAAGVDLQDDNQTADALKYQVAEQRAIAEGLVRAWWEQQGKRFVEDFEVLEVEREGRAELSDGLVLMFRPDALVRERATGDLYIVSWKTASMFGQRTIDQINSDMQSISEVWGVLNDKESRNRERQMGGGRSSKATIRDSVSGLSNSMLDLASRKEQHGIRSLVSEQAQGHQSIGSSEYVGDDKRSCLNEDGLGSPLSESRLRKTGSLGTSDTRGELPSRGEDEVHSSTNRRRSERTIKGDSISNSDEEARNQQASDLGGYSGNPKTIEGVYYIFIVKGQRRVDDWLGFKVQNTHIAYAWMKEGPTPDDTEWSWSYSYKTGEINPKTGGESSTKLGKGWRKVLVSEHFPGGVKGWIEALSRNEITPRHINALEGVFPQSMPVSRRADEIESWRRQVVAQETQIGRNVGLMQNVENNIATNGENPFELEALLDETFPQHTHSCFAYNSRCEFWECCFTPTVGVAPLSSGLYQIRVSNHPENGGDDD